MSDGTSVVDEIRNGLWGALTGFTGEGDTDEWPLNSTSNGYESVRIVKAGPGRLFGFTGYNSNAAAQFILVFDTDGPLTAASVPVLVVGAGGSSNFFYDVPGRLPIGLQGRVFRRGIVIANSSTGPTYTAGAADCWFDAQYV